MRKAYYVDSFSAGHFHEMYNASSLLMFSHLYDKIDFFAGRTASSNTIELLKELPANVSLHFHFIAENKKTRLRNGIRKIWSALLNIFYIIKAPQDTDIIINYNTVISLYPINFLVKFIRKRVLIVCHGEMQDILEKRPVSFLFKKSICFFKKTNVSVSKTLWFAVLGEAIKLNVLKIVSPQIAAKILSFEHTAIFSIVDEVPKNNGEKLVLGYLGGFRESKGASTFMELSRHFKSDKNIEFRFIGNVQGKGKELEDSGVVIPDGIGNCFIDRVVMYNHIKKLDYALYCFPRDGYKYTASGSLFDAIDCETPILSLKNDYFEGMFQECGDFGYLEDDFYSLERRIIWLKEHKKDAVWPMYQIKEKLSPAFAAQKFSESAWFNDKKN